MSTLERTYHLVAMLIASMADMGGIALAFHVDSLVPRFMLGAVVMHSAFGLCLWGCHKRQLRKTARAESKRVVGFVPPVTR